MYGAPSIMIVHDCPNKYQDNPHPASLTCLFFIYLLFILSLVFLRERELAWSLDTTWLPSFTFQADRCLASSRTFPNSTNVRTYENSDTEKNKYLIFFMHAIAIDKSSLEGLYSI